MSVARVCALIGIALHLARDKATVGTGVGDYMVANRVANAVAHEGFFTADVELDEPAADLHAAIAAERFVQRVLLVAESAADVGLDQANAAPGKAKRLPADAAHDVRNLRAGDDDDLACLLFGVADVVFDVAMLHDGRIIPTLDAHKAGLFDRLFKVADFVVRASQDVVLETLVQLRCAVLHGFLHIQNKGVFLILHFERANALIRRDFVLCNHDRDIVAVIAHVAVEQQTIRNVLMVRVGRPRMSRGRERTIRHVKARQHLDHAGNRRSGRGVNRFDQAVGNGRVVDFYDECAFVD